MATLIAVHVTGVDGLQKDLERFEKELPKKVIDGINKWGQGLRKSYSEHVASQHHYTGYLEKNIRWYNINKAGDFGYITMPTKGIYLSEARPHWVSLFKNPKLARWVSVKLRKSFTINGRPLNSILVRGHPFIHRYFQASLSRLRAELNFGVKRGLRK